MLPRAGLNTEETAHTEKNESQALCVLTLISILFVYTGVTFPNMYYPLTLNIRSHCSETQHHMHVSVSASIIGISYFLRKIDIRCSKCL